jgi:hypothetical protein
MKENEEEKEDIVWKRIAGALIINPTRDFSRRKIVDSCSAESSTAQLLVNKNHYLFTMSSPIPTTCIIFFKASKVSRHDSLCRSNEWNVSLFQNRCPARV